MKKFLRREVKLHTKEDFIRGRYSPVLGNSDGREVLPLHPLRKVIQRVIAEQGGPTGY